MAAQKLRSSDYERLGRVVAHIFETGYVNKSRLLKLSFAKGVMTGFGGVIGATIVVTILLWLLSLFNRIPLIGPLVDGVRDTVQIENEP